MVRNFVTYLRGNNWLGYSVQFDGVGLPKTNDDSRGFCSQFAVFEKQENQISGEDRPPKKVL